MGRGIGIVAGSGAFVAGALSELRRRGLRCVVLGIRGEASPALKAAADVFSWIKPGELARAVAFFKDHDISETLLLGKVRSDVVFRQDQFEAETWKRVGQIKKRSAPDVLNAALAFLERNGIKVLSPGPLLAPYFCRPGVLTKANPTRAALEDIIFGLKTARQAADLEIGQTLVVKSGTVVAVEGLEGTDQAIRRGGRLAGPGFVVVKAGRTSQNMKIDVPAVGLDTVKALLQAGGVALGIEARQVAFFQKEEAISLADSQGASIVVRAMG
jgi:UDP-2,3-diacylglucosamine hydrolase